MLRNRVITALIMAPLVVAAVFWLDAFWFGLLFWSLAALAMYEWAGLAAWTSSGARLAYVAVFAAAVYAIASQPLWHSGLLLCGTAFWTIAVIAVLAYPRGAAAYSSRWLLAPLGIALGSIAWVAIMSIHQQPGGSWWLLWMFGVVWGADIGAYFAGRAFGKTRLAPQVSPGKTWEGVAGGVALPGLVCGAAVVLWQDDALKWLLILLLLVVVSVFGDLFESLLKRATGVKDSGNLLPGHGGMLDRIDSILAVLPVLAMVLVYG